MKRVISILLSAIMLLSVWAMPALAAEQPPVLTVTASGGTDTVSVTARTTPSDDNNGGTATGKSLSLSAAGQTIARDYAQTVSVRVENTSAQPVSYYLTCTNDNDDIYMNFVGSGSKDAPLTIAAGQTQLVPLSVFAQNATKANYTVNVSAVVTGEREPLTMALTFGCNLTAGSVSFTKKSTDDATLATVYTVENTGRDTITDLTLSVTGQAAEYVRISPGVENYEIKAGKTVEIKLIPDLGKMKANGKTVITGRLTASGGVSAETDIMFDTQGKPISSMTMLELAYRQERNPYPNLSAVDDTVDGSIGGHTVRDLAAGYLKDGTGVNTAEEVEQVYDELFDSTGMLDMSMKSDLTYGEQSDGTLPVSLSVQSAVVTEPRADSEDVVATHSYAEATGTHTYTTTVYMTRSEYNAMLAGFRSDVADKFDLPAPTETATLMAASNEPDADDEIAVSYVWSISTGVSDYVTDHYTDYGAGFAAIHGLDVIVNTGETISDGANAFGVLASPSYTDNEKLTYIGLTGAKVYMRYWGGKAITAAMSASLDGPGFILGCMASALINYGLDKLCESMLRDGYGGGLFYDIYGSQCTNAGQVTSEFYVPDFGSSKPIVYETGRMYDGTPFDNRASYAEAQFGGDRYVHNRPVNYTYHLNGTQLGTSQNNGLTAVSIVPLDGADTALRAGKNTLVREYDTNAGHYSVTADTEITILYPNDTPVSYIGTPEGLEDVRLLPDFAVYEENILPETAIIGEETKVNVSVYNRGSRGGWVDISVSDGTATLAEKKGVYMEAFSEQTVTFDWTPTAEQVTLSVSLTGSADADERKSDNNAAERIIYARTRQIPVIDSITPDRVVLAADTDVRLIAALSSIADVTAVSFEVDGASCADVTLATLNQTAGQASVSVRDLTPGIHTARAVVTYNIAGGKTATVEKTQSITAIEPGTAVFTTDSTVQDPTFAVYRQSGTFLQAESVSVSAVSGGYQLTNSANTQAYFDKCWLVTTCDGGLIVTALSALNGATLSLADAEAVTIQMDSAVIPQNLQLTRLNNLTLSSSASRPALTPDATGTLRLSGVSDYRMQLTYLLDDLFGSVLINNSRVTNGVFDLSDYYCLYRIAMPAGQDYDVYTDFDCTLLYSEDGNRQIDYYVSYDEIAYNPSTNQLSILITDTYALEALNQASSVQALLTADYSTLYLVDLLAASPAAVWDHTAVSFRCSQADKFYVYSVDLLLQDAYIYLWNTPLYLPAADYRMFLTYQADGQNLYHDEALTITNQSSVTVELPGPKQKPARLTASWSSLWDSRATLFYDVESNGNIWSCNIPIERGQAASIPGDGQSPALMLMRYEDNQEIAYAEFAPDVTLSPDAALTVTVADSFAGSAVIRNDYTAGDTCSIRLSDLTDENGTSLLHYNGFRSDTRLNGMLRLTDTANPANIHTVTFTESNFHYTSSLYVTLPDNMPTGEYTYEVLLTTAALDPLSCTITFDANGGSGTMNALHVPTGDYTLPACAFTAPAGKVFKGWQIDGTMYSAGDVYTVQTDLTISAVWSSRHSPTGGGRPVEPAPLPVEPETVNPFTDVTQDDFFYEAVLWALENGITTGVTDTRFAPDDACTRAQMATFLWRAAGMPEPTGSGMPFADVPADAYYGKAVRWALEQGITAGVSADRFDPDAVCSRAQMAAFLFRFAGAATSGTATPFADVTADAYYADAVQWALENGITTGTGANTFSPDATCTRAQMVTFLYRHFAD